MVDIKSIFTSQKVRKTMGLVFSSVFIFIANSQRIFDGITVEEGYVHLDFKENGIWNRYKVGLAAGDDVYFGTTNSHGDKTTWIYSEGTNGMRFESVAHPGYVLGINSAQANDIGLLLVKLINSNKGTYGEWVPEPVSGETTHMLKNTYVGTFPITGQEVPAGCLHLHGGGDDFFMDRTCTKDTDKSRPFRIVPAFAHDCDTDTYYEYIQCMDICFCYI